VLSFVLSICEEARARQVQPSTFGVARF